ncbi:hypothetical protein K0M31_007360 [Melipona bicolor]|uniref:Uncharacterized protein n=1 Tax=Melipona bicolor TaxID=60889 RepID=A0AA40KVW9_9HYME|nr:hypothetical protein K0M31_007360 [Melipona bicolor]
MVRPDFAPKLPWLQSRGMKTCAGAPVTSCASKEVIRRAFRPFLSFGPVGVYPLFVPDVAKLPELATEGETKRTKNKTNLASRSCKIPPLAAETCRTGTDFPPGSHAGLSTPSARQASAHASVYFISGPSWNLPNSASRL